MEQSWRWFGPDDVVPLQAIRQAGAGGVVTALHEIPYGEVWSVAAIKARKALIEADPSLGLRWTVVESLPIHERIKLGEGDLGPLLAAYQESIRNLAVCGLRTICTNFMPVVDWTRTELRHVLPGGGRALRFNEHEFAAFDWLMLKRPGAEAEYTPDVLARARDWHVRASEGERDVLLASIMAGLPGAFDRYDIPGLRRMLARYAGIDAAALRANLVRFLRAVIPTVQECGVRLVWHPDDPPRPLMGLPRILSGAEDFRLLFEAVPSPANGLTLCTGSLGAGAANDVPEIARRFADRIGFAHLRNVRKEPDGSFMEAEHLGGDVDMVAVVIALLEEQARRQAAGDPGWRIPFRPDHGHELLDDVGKNAFPGYSAIGRLKGLAEVRGLIAAASRLRGLPS